MGDVEMTSMGDSQSKAKGSLSVEPTHSEKPVGILETVFNFANSIVGAGIIGLPFAMHEAGFVLGIILLIAVGIVTDVSLYLLISASEIANRGSYQSLIYHCFGKWGFYFVSIFIFIFPYGALIAYLLIIGDTIPAVLADWGGHDWWNDRRFVISVVVAFVIYPLCLLPKVGYLAKTSCVSLLAVLWICLSVTIAVFMGDNDMSDDRATDNAWQPARLSFFQAIGVIAFAFVTHHNSFVLYRSMRSRSLKKWSYTTHAAVGFSLLCSLWLSIVGYVGFQRNTEDNLLNNFGSSNQLINTSRLAFGLTMMLTFPLEMYVCREVVELLFFRGRPFNWIRHIMETTILTAVAWGIAMATTNLGAVLELTGSFSATIIAFILPAAVYIKKSPSPNSHPKMIACWCLLVLGIIVMVAATTFSILETAGVFEDDSRYES